MTGIVSVYATFASDEEARTIGRRIVEERLAACVNVLGPCHSIYRWEDKVEEGAEVAAIFKTSEGNGEALVARIRALHSYSLPAVAIWPISSATPGLSEWVLTSTVI